MNPEPSLCGMTLSPVTGRRPPRDFTSDGFTPEKAMRILTSPGPGVGVGSSPYFRTSFAGPFFSYHAACIACLPPRKRFLLKMRCSRRASRPARLRRAGNILQEPTGTGLLLQAVVVQKIRNRQNGNTFLCELLALLRSRRAANRALRSLAVMNAAGFLCKRTAHIFCFA